MQARRENFEHKCVEKKLPLVKVGLFSKSYGLEDMPKDIISLIAKHLDVKSLLALSKICKFIESNVCDYQNKAKMQPLKDLVVSRPELNSFNTALAVFGTCIAIGFISGALLARYGLYPYLKNHDFFTQILITLLFVTLGGFMGSVSSVIPWAILVGIINYCKNNTFIFPDSMDNYNKIELDIQEYLRKDEKHSDDASLNISLQ